MSTRTLRRYGASLAVMLAATAYTAPALAQNADAPGHLKAQKASVTKGPALNSAAARRGAVADVIAESYGEPGTAPTLELVAESRGRSGVVHQRFTQSIDGIRVHGAYVKAAKRGEALEHMIARTARGNGRKTRDGLSAADAIAAANARVFGGPQPDSFYHQPPTAEAVWVARPNGDLELGHEVVLWSENDNQLFHVLVDGKGRIVDTENRTSSDSYNVYPDHPGNTALTTVTNPADPTASPSGWLSGSQTTRLIRGNNASAYLDRDNNNGPDGGGVAVTDGNFLATHQPTQSPLTSGNQDLAVQNLFYFNNLIHDDLYAHGFTEGALNFQEDNFGKGGAGSDSVNAEAQDGGGTNNANFATPGDGSNPRMQMYVWTATNPNRDGDLDSDIIWHEYGHGLTWRMIGSMSGSVSGAIGEGMSDVLAILHNNDDRVGEYSTDDPAGIRSARYTNYPRTIGDFTGSSVHFDGEIYAAAAWRLSQLANAEGIDNEAVMDVLVDGMNFTPAGPDYLEMRDGILAAGDNAFDCLVWQAFADYGMGEGASFTIRTGGNPRNRIQITESSTVPSACNGGGDPTGGDASVASLTGSASPSGRRNWAATATVGVVSDGAAASDVVMSGRWSTGSTASCTTDASGSCSVSQGGLKTNRNPSVTFTVQTLNGQTATGSPLSVTINRP